MEHSFEYRLPLKRSHAWIREFPVVVSTFGAIDVRHFAQQTSDFAKIVLVFLLLENVITSEKPLRGCSR
jgi:hypothetical protein